jgi:putative ATPase
MRPATIEEVAGQQHILAREKPLYNAIKNGQLHSMVFWGPPGTGKTTLAKLIAVHGDATFISLSAVLSGVKDIRESVEAAKLRQQVGQGETVLFIDEVHRFNKAQQDAFLPHIENGTIVFVGATTENPSFELNNALLSRVRIYVLQSLSEQDITTVIESALQDSEKGLGQLELTMDASDIALLARIADGDARRALTLLEIASDMAEGGRITNGLITEVLSGGSLRRFDKGGDMFFDQISALHKSVRGSSPDAALYWFCRMIDGGCDPIYIARRVLRMASEDIGNADPRALQIALDAWQVQERLGSPEGELAIAQAIVYLSVAAKSNAVYAAFKRVRERDRKVGNKKKQPGP